jgi:ABC-type Fe3+/spermidine/putrescine transport system ATPase subunit
MTQIRLSGLSRTLGNTLAVNDVSLEIQSGELFFLLGPSGCGKTTLLNLIAGLEFPDKGHIHFGDQDVTLLPTERRNAVLCFQSYALFPHLTVEKNVRFGLEVRKLSAATSNERVEEVLDLVQLEPFRRRRPAELSGGQQQRVALARALAVKPSCLLLDEPLSNLDAQLRQEMRGEIRRVCKAAGYTTVYVTHDQKEALSMADRIAVMSAGRIVQVGTARELFERPTTAFVAEFISHSNVLGGQIIERGPLTRVRTPAGDLLVEAKALRDQSDRVTLAIRPDRLSLVLGDAAAGPTPLRGELIETSFLGDSSEHWIKVGDTSLRATHSPPLFELPREVVLRVDPGQIMVVDA